MHEKRSPTLRRVVRLDSIPLDGAQFTEEGYLIDRPIVTTTGIFEYGLPDGGIRRELRLPEDVFDPKSLASYKGKPVILTHAGGKIDKTNVQGEHIGTVLSEGYQDGGDVRAEIVIHATDIVERSGLKELSLGYECDWEEQPGEWNGQPYDAIQHNIRINHLAVVHKARAGEKARLNMDGEEKECLKGEKKSMNGNRKSSKKAGSQMRKDGFTPEQEEEFRQFLAWKAAQAGAGATDEGGAGQALEKTDEELVEQVRAHQGDGEPEDPVSALARANEDIVALLGVIDRMAAQKDMEPATDEDGTQEPDGDGPKNQDECGPEEHGGSGDGKADEGDGAVKEEKEMTADSIDAAIRARVEIARVGDRLNLDGLDSVSVRDAKKLIIAAVNPSLRLDGKSDAYIDAAYDVAKNSVMRPKNVDYQRRQMNGLAPSGVRRMDSAGDAGSSAAESRQKLLDRRGGKK